MAPPPPPEPRALSRPGVRVMESPHHGAPDPGSHPRIATEAAHPGAGSRRCRNAIQMYAAACSRTWSVAPKHHGDVPMKGQWRLRRFLPLLCLFVSGASYRSIIAGKFTQIPQNPCQPMTSRPRGRVGFIWGTLMKRQAAGSLKNCCWCCGIRWLP